MRTYRCAAAALLIAGCDPGFDLAVDVHVPAASQAAVSAYPQQVVFRWGVQGGSYHHLVRVGVLCAPSDVEAVLPAHAGGLGKCPDLELSAWLAPLELPAGAACQAGAREDDLDACATLDPAVRPDCVPPAGAPRADALSPDTCGGSKTASLTLAPP